jgi:hypothetical protein
MGENGDEPTRDEQIWQRRQDGDLLADIGYDLGLTPLQVLDILRAEEGRRAGGGTDEMS